MADLDLTSRPVLRGRLTSLRGRQTVEFLYNPKDIKEKKGAYLAEDPIPGASDPILKWMGGKTSTITFSLELCGESTRRLRGFSFPNDANLTHNLIPPDESFTIEGELAFFEQFMFPVDPEDQAEGGADVVIFTFGTRYPGVACLMEAADIDITEFSPDLEPTRATLAITLKRFVQKTRWAHEIWRHNGDIFNVGGGLNQ